jgi:2-polyprenyl-3-methyl-5-hydroxy-6-metoxy-1,4-benzoquinol methylase
MSNEDKTPGSYRDQIYESYLTTTFEARNVVSREGVNEAARVYVREMGPFLPGDKAASILEIGCGLGGFLTAVYNLGYSNITGLDISPEQVAFCHKLGFEDVFCADGVTFLSETTAQYDLVVMSDVLEHIPKEQVLKTLSLIFQHLKSGGKVILRVPNLSNPLNIRTRYVDFSHEVGFTRESLEQILRVSGFAVDSVHGAYVEDPRWFIRLIFDRILRRLFIEFYHRTMHLSSDVIPGKNLIAVGQKPG